MAYMYPRLREKINAPNSEQLAYDELSRLPNDFIIFHSVQWVRKNINRNFTWYENDYLILHKDYGILLLEVKGGHCYFQDGLMHQQNSVTKKEIVLDEGNDPLSQAQRGIQHFRGVIKKNVLECEGRICIEPLIWFPACQFDPHQNLPANYHDVSFAILDSSVFSSEPGPSLEQRLNAVYRGYGARQKTVLTDQQVESIKNIIAPDFDLTPSPSILKTEIDNAFIRLTNEQSVLLDYIEEQRYAAIQGAAGTGKDSKEDLTWIAQSECRLLLSKNCRNTMEIAKTAYSVIDYDVLQKMNHISGEQPTIVFAEKDAVHKLGAIVQFYLDRGFKQEEIAVLTMKTEDRSILKGVKRLGGIAFVNAPEDAGVLFTTARKFKGLENKVIIITDIDEECFADPAIKKVFYVACSRATQRLSLLISGGPQQIDRIAAAIPGAGFSGKGKIILKTKTMALKVYDMLPIE